MYKVLLVDDERILLEGLSVVVEWDRHGTILAGKARNGSEALELIAASRPHIVITDLKMPVMNGLELIEHVREAYPDIVFVILSGHEQFEFAQRAMQYGVRHYLLKPCSESDITDVLDRVVEELRDEEEKSRFTHGIRDQFEKLKPQLRQQLMKEFLTNKAYGAREREHYRALVGLPADDTRVRLLLFELDGRHDYEHVFALHNIASELVGACSAIHLDATIGERVAILVDDAAPERLMPALEQIRSVYKSYYELDVTVAVSDVAGAGNMRALYMEALECLSYRFYIGEGSILTRSDTPRGVHAPDLPDSDELALAVRSGNVEHSTALLQQCFRALKSARVDVRVAKTYLAELYMVLIRQAPESTMNGYFEQAVRFVALDTIDQMEEFVLRIALDIASARYDSNVHSRSALVRQMIAYIETHLHDETLTLGKLANEVFFMNADHLGRLFRKETGERFSNYLLSARIDKAKQLIRQSGPFGPKVGALAEAVGFGNAPHYFSQVFKKHAGCTPTEFKRRMSEN